MRRNLALAAILAALPGAATAQEPAAPPNEGGPSETDFLPVASDPTPRDFGGAPEGDDVPWSPEASGSVPASHVVQPGDTLWDISGRYLQNPWYWPKVWSYNPQIENPHWIYPGDEIRLAPADGAQEGPATPGGIFEEAPGRDVSVAGRIGVRPPERTLAPRLGFVTEEELQQSGVVAKSWEEKALLMEGDRIYVAWTSDTPVEVGSNYLLYRTEREVSHPEGGTVGYLTRILGTARVIDADPREEYLTAVITRSLVEIERGDRVGPAVGSLLRRVARRPNAANVDAFILATVEEEISEVGQGHVVFLDRGSADGVAEGNTFDVLRAGDGLDDDGYTPYFDEELPVERIGSLLVVDVRERTSAAVVLRSIRELRVGDRVEMRVAAN